MRHEFQIKIRGSIDSGKLISLGGEYLSQTVTQDIYLAGHGTRRIRIENDHYVLSRKSSDIGIGARVRMVSDKIISKDEAGKIIKEAGVRVSFHKTRSLYRISSSLIAIDEVEGLGNFLEVRSDSEKELHETVALLGFSQKDLVRESYLEMMIDQKLSFWVKLVLGIHNRVGELIFGIISGILTTTGVLVGVNSATSSRISVIAAIASIAVADSCSDAFGIYMSKVSERGMAKSKAIRYALGTMIGKFIFPITFLLPILFLPLSTSILIDLAWATIVLILLSIEGAIVSQKSILGMILRNLSIASAIVLLSFEVGRLISGLIHLN